MIKLTKHHGLGNDFLVAVDPARRLDPTDALKLCDRRRGIGADGLISADPLSSDGSLWSMVLFNADGSRAEISGNGIRCLGQALLMHLNIDQRFTFEIRTDAGIRNLDIWPDRRGGNHQARVNMGTATDGPQPYEKWDVLGLEVLRQRTVDIGNPHLVVEMDDPEYVDLRAIGPEIETSYEDGINLHLIRIEDPQNIRLWVWERGAGITEACGSGASAAAWAAHQWGAVEDRVNVHQPGGSAVVNLGADPQDPVHLTGPTTFIAEIGVHD